MIQAILFFRPNIHKGFVMSSIIFAENKLFQTETRKTVALEYATMEIIKNFYQLHSSTIYIWTSSRNGQDQLEQLEIVNHILKKSNGDFGITCMLLNEKVNAPVAHMRTHVFFVDSYDSFR